ncbi:unnamed protein product [Laminaria digitata]
MFAPGPRTRSQSKRVAEMFVASEIQQDFDLPSDSDFLVELCSDVSQETDSDFFSLQHIRQVVDEPPHSTFSVPPSSDRILNEPTVPLNRVSPSFTPMLLTTSALDSELYPIFVRPSHYEPVALFESWPDFNIEYFFSPENARDFHWILYVR